MNYYDWLTLTKIGLKKLFVMDGENLKLPVSLTREDIYEEPYNPDRLSKKSIFILFIF
jgi:hypothetical protein